MPLVTNPNKVLAVLLALTGAVAGIGVVAEVGEHSFLGAHADLLDRLELDDEKSVPTLLGTSMLALGAAGAALLSWSERRRGGGEARGWALLCAVLLLFTLDEHLAMHETLIQPLRDLLGAGGLLHFTWIVPGMIATAALLAALVPFHGRLDPAVGRPLVLAAALFFGGAIGMEAVGGLYASTYGDGGLVYELLTCLEETLELLGAAVLLFALAGALALQRPPLQITAGELDPSRAVRAGAVVVGALALISMVAMLADVLVLHGTLDSATSRLDVATERSVPTLLSTLLFLTAAALFAGIGAGERRSGRSSGLRWLFLALLFTALAVDERVEVHEALTLPVRELLGLGGGLLEYAWIVPGAVGVVVLGLAYAKFLAALPRRTLRMLCAAAGVFLAGALGVEAVGGLVAGESGKDNALYVLLTTAEEALEMMGLVLLSGALLSYMRDQLPELSLGVVPSTARPLVRLTFAGRRRARLLRQ